MSQLQKARLFSLDSNQFDFEFMFNPNALQFSESVKVKDAEGARTAQGQPKVSFQYPQARSLNLNRIMFDTYEEGVSVMEKYINKLRKAVEFCGFTSPGQAPISRPPIYMFVWGGQNYMRCFVEKLDYRLTMFLPDGTPVRADVKLSLKEVDESYTSPNARTYDPTQFGDRDARTQPTQPIRLRSDWQQEVNRLETESNDLRARAAAKRAEAAHHRRSEKGRRPDHAAAEAAEREAQELENQAAPKAELAQQTRALYERFNAEKK